jgi:thiamine biosynthesis lipoprotein
VTTVHLRGGRLLSALAFGALILAVSVWWNRFQTTDSALTVRSDPVGIMGTRCSIVAVIPRSEAEDGSRILRAAERELRRLEGLLSTWIGASEISALNHAAVGAVVPLSPEPLAVLSHAAELYDATDGAFDITALPIIELWRLATEVNVPPDPLTLEVARASSTWQDLELTSSAARKHRSSVRVDIDGLAKGYAIDRATEALARAGAAGGLIEVGGDLRVFGPSPEGGTWPVGIRNPFDDGVSGRIELEEGAACTSGSYARPLVIGGTEYSHIIDPRTGLPVAETASVTVTAPDAATADAWATALAVSGVDGLETLPSGAGIEALIIGGTSENPTAVVTKGFPEILDTKGLSLHRR